MQTHAHTYMYMHLQKVFETPQLSFGTRLEDICRVQKDVSSGAPAQDDDSSTMVLRGSYHQRRPLEHTFFRPFPRLVLSCINADVCN